MGLCQCVLKDYGSQKTVDIVTLKNDLKNIAQEPKTSPKIFEEQPDEMQIESKQEKDNYINPQKSLNIPNSDLLHPKIPTTSFQIQDPGFKDSNPPPNQQQKQSSLIHLHLSLEPYDHRSEVKDSGIVFTKRTASRFINRSYINIVILGGKGVGKSAFVIKFIENVFEKLYIPTLGVEVRKKQYSFNNHLYTLNFTVTSGNDYKSDYSKAYEAVDFFLVFYDITSMDTFIEAKKILKGDVKNYLYAYDATMTNVFLVGNKIDSSPRNVPEEVAKAFCDKNKFQMFDISVKTNKNITIMMKGLIKTVDDIAYSSSI